MKRFLAFVLTLTCLASAGIPKYLVTARGLSDMDIMAVVELQHFWREIFGTELENAFENIPDEGCVYLGHTEYAKGQGIDFGTFAKEEWEVRNVGGNVIIGGGSGIGTLYGVYSYLEAIGVRFLTWERTVIPKDIKDVPELNERRKPFFDGRLIATRMPREFHLTQASEVVAEAYRKWLLRIRCNGQEYVHFKVLYSGDALRTNQIPQFHTLMSFVPHKKYFAEHPEYFSMNESGQRFAPYNFESGGGICMSNPDVVKITSEALREMIRKDRKDADTEEYPLFYDISVLDATSYICCCEECRKISAEEGSDTGLLIRFLNAVLENISDEFPEITLRTMAYGPTVKPIFKTIPDKRIQFQVTDSHSRRDSFRPLSHQFNKEYLQVFEDWRQKVNRLWIWEYRNYSFSNGTPRTEVTFDSLQPDIQYFSSFKPDALFFEWERDYMSPQNFIDLQYYVTYRLLVNPSLDPEKEAQEFIDGYYGGGSAVMRKYFDLMREGVRRHPSVQTSLFASTWQFMTPEFALGFYRDVKAAAEALPEGDFCRRNMEFELISPIWEMLSKRYVFEDAFRDAGISMDTLAKECHDLAWKYMNAYPASKHEVVTRDFEKRYAAAVNSVPIPERFNGIDARRIRILQGGMDSVAVPSMNAAVASDPDASGGKAFRSANKDENCHGVAKTMTGKYNFITTRFVWGNFKGDGTELIIKEVPDDEKYHWYEMPKAVTLKGESYFWGHGWAINVPTSRIFEMTDHVVEDNTYKCHFRLKFTGPAYVPGSTQENAIWLDLVVLVRE